MKGAITIETEKLYSPLFCQLQDNDNKEDYGGDYWSDPMSQQEAVYYEDEIRAALLRERMPDEEPRGLMTYYHYHGEDGDSVDDKVHSLFVDVEVHEGKLWGVATLTLTESLTPEELHTLKDYLTGQYSDGFGEGFEQRDIKIDQGELNVSLWNSGDEFFIDTEREFRQRLGLEMPEERQTPAQAALHEPDTFDNPGTASLRRELIERLDANLSDYFDTLRGLDGQEIADMSSEIGAKMDAHYYLSEIHNFHTSEAEYLLQFQNPLEVVADEFLFAGTEDRSDIMWKIFDRQDALQGDYPLNNDEPPASAAPEKAAPVTRDELLEHIAKKHCRFETLETRKRDSLDFREVSVWGLKAALEEAFQAGAARQREKTGAKREAPVLDAESQREKLFFRLDKNLSDYCESLMNVDKRELIGMAEDIAARYAAREYLKTGYDYKSGEVEYLLQFQDPLTLVADGWPGTLDGLVPMDGTVSDILEDRGSHGHYSRVLDAEAPAAKQSARDASTEKRSVMEQIREAAKAPKEPRKNKEARDKSGPEL